MRPKLLDLFCGAGGAAMGYYRAGFDVVGIDIKPQPRYPFPFIQGDALNPPVDLSKFNVIHASPPCQGYTPMANRWGSKAPKLIPELLALVGSRTYVIENVVGSPLYGACLCGQWFGLDTYRHRIFQSNFFLFGTPCQHDKVRQAIYGKADGRRLFDRVDGTQLRAWTFQEGCAALAIDWMVEDELRESIPPAYTEFIGKQLLEHLK